MTENTSAGPAIVVYGASSENIDPKFKDAAFKVGVLAARAGLTLVSGGGRQGLMRAAIDGAASQGGRTVGVLPQFMIDKNWQHPGLSRLIATESMHQRKQTMASMAMAAIACPGGCGTFEELLEIITWRQLNLYRGQVVILNTDGYYDPLIQMFERAIDNGFMHADHRRLFTVAASPEQAIEAAMKPVEPTDFSQKIH